MANQKLTEYEHKRLENVRRNKEMMNALKIHSKASEFYTRPTRTYVKKPKTETLIVTRRSLRTRGIQPDSKGLALKTNADSKTAPPIVTSGSFPTKNAYRGTNSDRQFLESLASMVNDETLAKSKTEGSFELESLSLDPKNIARVVPGRITELQLFPSSDVRMLVACSTIGEIGFWNIDEGNVFLYHPHRAYISDISVHQHCLSKIYTCCYDGFVRVMDTEKEIFDMVYISDECIYSLSQSKNDSNCLYFGEGSRVLTVCDKRIPNCASHFDLHRGRINTIDFNPENTHIVATSSSDGTASTWDLRCTGGGCKIAPIRTFIHQNRRGLQSAYFSPSGRMLATTSVDNTIGIFSGVNFEDVTSVYDNQTGKGLSTYRAIWGWDDSYLFDVNGKREVDVVSTVQKAIVMTLQSLYMSAIPLRLNAHSYEVGLLAGSTTGGLVYVWTSS